MSLISTISSAKEVVNYMNNTNFKVFKYTNKGNEVSKHKNKYK
jgi:hypothetical protein